MQVLDSLNFDQKLIFQNSYFFFHIRIQNFLSIWVPKIKLTFFPDLFEAKMVISDSVKSQF